MTAASTSTRSGFTGHTAHSPHGGHAVSSAANQRSGRGGALSTAIDAGSSGHGASPKGKAKASLAFLGPQHAGGMNSQGPTPAIQGALKIRLAQPQKLSPAPSPNTPPGSSFDSLLLPGKKAGVVGFHLDGAAYAPARNDSWDSFEALGAADGKRPRRTQGRASCRLRWGAPRWADALFTEMSLKPLILRLSPLRPAGTTPPREIGGQSGSLAPAGAGIRRNPPGAGPIAHGTGSAGSEDGPPSLAAGGGRPGAVPLSNPASIWDTGA